MIFSINGNKNFRQKFIIAMIFWPFSFFMIDRDELTDHFN